MQQCLFCGQTGKMIHVHGHYQCSVCHTNALPCCDGDNCETNYFFRENANNQQHISLETFPEKKDENTKAL